VASLLRHQREELRGTVGRLPHLRGSAREDVFLRVRRLLAVHEALERRVVTPRAGGEESPSAAPFVRAAEQADHESPDFDVACARMVASHLGPSPRHAPGRTDRPGDGLADEDRAVVGAAVRLWHGEGEAYLGNSYDEMLAAVEEQLDTSAEHGEPPL
jgi:hypothetical protein